MDKHAKDDEITVRLCNYSDVYYNERIRADMNFMKATATTEEINRFLLVPDDVIITKDSESWNDIGVPALVENGSDDLICGYHLAICRPIFDLITGAFLYQVLSCRTVANQFFVRANGVTRFGLSQSSIKSVRLPMPPLAEQVAIACFLDHTDRRIRRYIRAKEKLVALLQEYQQVLVSDAVTGRIDVRTAKPYPACKDSGVEWLGKLPAHWGVRRLKYLLSECEARSIDGSEKLLRVSQYTGVTQRQPMGTGDGLDSRAESLVGYKCVDPNDLAVNIMLAWNGSMGVSRFHGIVSPAYCVYRFTTGAYPRYFHYLLRSRIYKARIKAVSTGVVPSRLRLYTDDLYRLTAHCPAHPEQVTIAHFLDKMTERLQKGIAQARREIELLREYRTRLIADVVTGKLDVRTATIRLSEVSPTDSDESLDHGSVASNRFAPSRQNDGLGYDDSAERVDHQHEDPE